LRAPAVDWRHDFGSNLMHLLEVLSMATLDELPRSGLTGHKRTYRSVSKSGYSLLPRDGRVAAKPRSWSRASSSLLFLLGAA